MEQKPLQNTPSHTPTTFPGPWPWYVLLVIGVAITGFFSWLMVLWAAYRRERKGTAILFFVINLILFLLFGWVLLKSSVAWWWLTSLTYLFNVIWALTAWIFQRKTLGVAARRYILSEWKSWISPVLIGIVLGVCIAIVFSTIPAVQNRVEMGQTGDRLNRETILWDFFRYIPLGIVVGGLLGLWWAGECRHFRASYMITFLSALTLTILFWLCLGISLFFLIHKGIMGYMLTFSAWEVIPPWVTGFRKYLLQIYAFDMSALLVVPLLFGAVSRIRDFGKRALLIPLTFACLLPKVFIEKEWWNGIQDQILYEMSSPKSQTRTSAHEWAEIMLTRYPNHLQWPRIAEKVAQYFYKEGKYEKARALYQAILDRYSNSNQWYWSVERARAALNDPDFGISPSEPALKIPIVDYEGYLIHNWMTLLSVIRYWEDPATPESEVKIRLKDLSLSDDQIALISLDSFADLDDAARNLGYEVLILPADLAAAKALISDGIPVIHHYYTSFRLLFNFDESRSVICAYSFDRLSSRLRRESPKEAKEILEIEEEGRGESQKRLARIANEAYVEYVADFWKSPALRYVGPLMAIVFPAEKSEAIATALDTSPEKLQKESDGYLATLISLSYLSHADPVHAVEWAKAAAEKTTDPMPLYAAHLAKEFWESRDHEIKSTIRLQDQFPELAQVFTYFNEAENTGFLERARIRFESDLHTESLPWNILHTYTNMLEQSDPDDFDQIVQIMQKNLSADPSSYNYWAFLADTYEWAGDTAGMVEALQGAISANPMASNAKLRLVYGCVVLEHYAEAQSMLETIDIGEIGYDADYVFCLGAIAEWEGDVKNALKRYGQAIEMRRYKSMYHLKYGKLLLQEGQQENARKALEWAARIDAGEEIKKEAENLLANM